VGLADALLGRPEVLILDEPTDGLDPNQREEVLALVAQLGRERTVILSTHVLPEVERVCQRVLILDRGQVIAAGKPEELGRSDLRLRVVARGDAAALGSALRALAGVEAVDADPSSEAGTHAWVVRTARDLREEVARAVGAAGALLELRPATLGLEAVFRRLTGGDGDAGRPGGAGR
jgi:ABC-2 type transport system ATP-binding protein